MKTNVKTYLAELKERHQVTDEQREKQAQRAEDLYRMNGFIVQYPGLLAHQLCAKLVEQLPKGYTFHSVLAQGIYNLLSMAKPQEIQDAELAEARMLAVTKLEEQSVARVQAELNEFMAEEEAKAVEAAQQKERQRIAELKADLIAEMAK